MGSGLCGASTNLWALVISRAIAGIGGGGMNTMSSVITSDLVSLRERGKYQGYANIAYGVKYTKKKHHLILLTLMMYSLAR